jgi:single-strand DNA-binding protein
MATDLNVVALVGRLTKDAELRYTQGGMGILRFSIAVNRRKRSGDNNWEDEANFFDCSMFGKSAENMSQYLTKGKQVSVLGELRQSRWETDGQNRSKVEIAVNSLQLLGSAGGSGNGGAQHMAPRPMQQSAAKAPASPMAPKADNAAPVPDMDPPAAGPDQFDDDNIPF